MDQYFSELISLIQSTDTSTHHDPIPSSDGDHEDVNYFLSRERHFDASFPGEQHLITRIRHYLSVSPYATELRLRNEHIDQILKDNLLKHMLNDFTEVQRTIRDDLDKSNQWKASLQQKLTRDDRLPASPRFRSAQRQGSTLHPRETPESSRAVSATRNQNKPALSESEILQGLSRSSQSMGSLKDILPIVDRLMFGTKHPYDIREIIKQFNTNFQRMHAQWQDRTPPQWIACDNSASSDNVLCDPLAYLTSIGAYPTLTLMKQNKKTFTGQWVAGAIMAHIDIHHTLHADKQYRSGKLNRSLSFDLDLEVFRQLFHIIEQLLPSSIATHGNINLTFVFNMSLRLFTTHLKYLSLLARHQNTTDTCRTTASKATDRIEYPSDDVWLTWFETLHTLTTNESQSTIYGRQAAKAMMCILGKQPSPFAERLFDISERIRDNRYPILIEEYAIALMDNTNLMTWIDLVSHEHDGNNRHWTIITSLINVYQHSSRPVQRILERFQQLLLIRLINGETSMLALLIRYLLSLCEQCSIDNPLLTAFFICLSLLNVIEDRMRFTFVFTSILPILSDFLLQELARTDIPNSSASLVLVWLVGHISHSLTTGQPRHRLESKHVELLTSPLFSSGAEINTINEQLLQSNITRYTQLTFADPHEPTPSDDHEFLMSIYHNIHPGAQLLTKMRTFTQEKHRALQPSIEQQANRACAHLFAVYLKHNRRVFLAKDELACTETHPPHANLSSLFERAAQIRLTFGTRRGQGGNCDELYEEIRVRSLFLLSSVKASHWLPVGDTLQLSCSTHTRRLRQTFDVCRRFQRLIGSNKQRFNREEIMHRAIVNYVYGDESRWDLDEVRQCMSYQHERAVLRWIIYRFLQTILHKSSQIDDKHRTMNVVTLLLPSVRNPDIEWSYLDNIPAVNPRWKKQIGQIYYSFVHSLLCPTSSHQTNLIFYLLNLSYTRDDIQYLHEYDLPQRLFSLLVTSSNPSLSPDSRSLAYQWFRLFVLQSWQHTHTDDAIQPVSELQWIVDELKHLFSSSDVPQLPKISLRNDAFPCVNKHETNQYLLLLLRSVTVYKHIRTRCATLEYFNQFWHMYQSSTNLLTRLLVLRIVRQIVPHGQVNVPITTLTQEIISTIGQNIRSREQPSEVLTELIYIYRVLMSPASAWHRIATDYLADVITAHCRSFASADVNRLNDLVACLSILGGYIHSFGVGSLVRVYVEDRFDQETQLAVILEIDSSTPFPYLVQYSRTNQTRWVTLDQLRIELDVLPPDLLDLSAARATIGQLFDALINIIELDESRIDSHVILSLKRRSIGVLYRGLTSKKLLEIFLDKPRAFIIAKLSTTALSAIQGLQPTDLHLLNKRHLEQYCLSLDRCEHRKEIVDERTDDVKFHLWHHSPFNDDDVSMINTDDDDLDNIQWKPIASKQYVDDYKRGRVGNDEIVIVPVMSEIPSQWMLEECGADHRFPGRMYLMNETGNTSLMTFTVDKLRLTEGKWYFGIRLLESQLVHIGWATNGFRPSTTVGIGDDQYSWSYNGSQGTIHHQIESPFLTDDLRWKSHDVCGCAIEINGDETRIDYWLNGQFVGTAFAHDFSIGSTDTNCNMRPHGSATTYYPCVTLRVNETSLLSTCEWIFSPDELGECPLPNGYKPLLVPKISTLVRYPFSAYMLSGDGRDNLHGSRSAPSTIFLRDFVHEHHIETKFCVDADRVVLTQGSQGLPFVIEHADSWTISFELELLSNDSNEPICLLTLRPTSSVRIPSNKFRKNTRIAIVFDVNHQQIKTYMNQEYKTSHMSLAMPITLRLLPIAAASIRKLAFWHDALPEQQIRSLFKSGLNHIASDYHRLTKHRTMANTWTFQSEQRRFLDGDLVPLRSPFTPEKWHRAQHQSENDEWKYFQSIEGTDQSAVQLDRNTTYLVLNKSTHPWPEYTLIVDVRIDHFPAQNERLTLVTFNSDVSLYLTHEGQLSLTAPPRTTSAFTWKPNQYVRLLITVDESTLKVYVDGQLFLEEQPLLISDDHLDLFREHDRTKNDKRDIKCKSITFLTKHINDISDDLKSSDQSLEHLVAPPVSLLARSLLLIGHDPSCIKSVCTQHPTSKIYSLDRILREQQQATIATDKSSPRDDLLAKLNPSIDKSKLHNLLPFSKFDTDETLVTLGAVLFEHWHALQVSNPRPSSDQNWFDQAVHHLHINKRFKEWIQDSSMTPTSPDDLTYQLFDLDRPSSEPILSIEQHWKQTHYSHQHIPRTQWLTRRTACEHGLISIYAHYTILNMLKVWAIDGSSLFPLEQFGDYTFVLTLFRLFDYHYHRTRLHTDESIDRMSLLMKTILKVEIVQLLHQQSKSTPLLYELQKNLTIQMIQLIAKPSLLLDDDDSHSIHFIEKANFPFVLKVLNLFLALLTDSSTRKQVEIDVLVPFVFPTIFIEHLFDLFLLCPTHQSKILILHLFTELARTSERVHFSELIRHFFVHLLSMSNHTTKTFRIALFDFVYRLFERYRNELKDLSFPSEFHDLLTFLETFNALNHRTSFPESFILQSLVLLPDHVRLTRDELDQCQHYFDITADHQLIDYMDCHLLTNVSLKTLIASLPSDTSDHATHYQTYPALWHIPAHCIRTRVEFFCLFSVFVEKIVVIADLSLPIGQSFLTDQLRSTRPYVLRTTKFRLLQTTLLVTALPSENNMTSVNFDTIQASITTGKSMFEQAYEQLHSTAHVLFRREDERLWRAQYLGMHSTDQGGPYRDSITCICADICSTRLPLFILCPNGRMNEGFNRDRWIPNVFPPMESIPNAIKRQYRFVGQLMGMAIRKKFYFDLKFATLMWKQLVKEKITMEDIVAIDVQSFTVINEMEKALQSTDTENDVLNSILEELRFEVVSASGQTFELVSGGRNVSITWQNLKEYCASYRQYRLEEFSRQIEYIRQGLHSVISDYFLSLFTARQLEEAVCGKGEMDIELLARNTVYGDRFQSTSRCIQNFWTVLTTKFTEEQKKLFLKFVWGRSTLPSRQEDFTAKFVINPFTVDNGRVNGALPRAHTCSFTLDLPEYSSVDVMYDRLNYAISNCSSIDGDGNMNELPGNLDFN